MNEEVCLLLRIEGIFVMLPEDGMTTVRLLTFADSTWQRESKWQ